MSETVMDLRTHRRTSEALVEQYLERIQAAPEVNAVVELDPGRSRQAAARADRLLARNPGSAPPLCGVPITVKRTFATAGFGLDSSSMSERGVRDAAIVRRLRAAGTVLLGRTNAPVGAADIDTYHPQFGRTRNPVALAASPGGSSGGSAAAVAACHTTFDLGSDTSGSARIPAGCCGVFALRPTQGILSAHGHHPAPARGASAADILTPSPITRSADDLRLVWQVLGGRAASTAKAPIRIASVTQTEPLDQDIEVAAALASAVSSLREAGFEVHDVQLPVSLRENWLYFQQLLFMRETRRGPDLARSIADLVPPPALESEPLEIALWAAGAGEDERRRIRTVRAAYRKAWSRFFSDYSALLLPVMQVAVLAPRDERVPVLADTIVVAGETQPMFSLSMWCALASFSGLPAVSLPVGRTSSGSPIGAQLVAGRGQDSDLLDLVVDVAKLVGQ